MKNDFIVKVFFRGDWCPWCNAYLRDFNDMALDKIQRLGGTVVGITSQVGNQSKTNNQLGFNILIDEKNLEAQKYDIFITPKEHTPLKDVEGAYRNGMVQPGVVIEDAKGRMLYRWAIDPNEMNFGGATDRPLVKDIVDALEDILAGNHGGDAFNTTDMAYLKKLHPDQYKVVQDYLASMGE